MQLLRVRTLQGGLHKPETSMPVLWTTPKLYLKTCEAMLCKTRNYSTVISFNRQSFNLLTVARQEDVVVG